MFLLKIFILFFLFLISCIIGIILSKKYSNRLKELKQIRNALNIFENKIKFTYEPIPEVFEELSKKNKGTVGEIFNKTNELMKKGTAGKAWETSIDTVQSNFNKEDKDTLKTLGKLLGKTDIDGQISQLKLVNRFLDVQIDNAEKEKQKGEKLYKKLGVICGLALIVILI